MINIKNFIPKIDIKMTKQEALELNSLALAFIGDSVQTFALKTSLAFNVKDKVNVLQKEISKKINAKTQADFIKKISDILTEEELDVFKRARNTKIKTKAKNSCIGDYKYATGFEALIGYLYLIGEYDRLGYILSLDGDEEC